MSTADEQERPRGGRMSALAIVAFVLSFIVGPIGSLLGIIAVVIVATSKGRLRGLGFGISAICVGISVWGILAAVAIPSFLNYIKRAKSTEATVNVDRIYQGAVSYFAAERTGPNGEVVARALPQSTDWTPAAPCCQQGGEEGKCGAAANAGAWETPAWKALDFSMADDFYYQYRVLVQGGELVVQARGDLDCDGITSLFERRGSVTASGEIAGSPEITKTDPLE
jgi:type II secretory pathway pseudopilin PulG